MGRGDSAKATQLNMANAGQGAALTGQGATGITTAIRDFRDQINEKIFNKNPYTDPTYLANVRSAASSVESGAQNAGNTKIEDYAQRSGENSGNVMAQEEEGARESARRQHQILTANAIDNQDKRQKQLMEGVAMLGQIPGMYSPVIGSGTSLSTGGASGETQLAGQGSWFDNLLNSGIAAGGTLGSAVLGGKKS